MTLHSIDPRDLNDSNGQCEACDECRARQSVGASAPIDDILLVDRKLRLLRPRLIMLTALIAAGQWIEFRVDSAYVQ